MELNAPCDLPLTPSEKGLEFVFPPQADASDSDVQLELAQPPRVLIVEDEWLVAAEVEATLEEMGVSVVGVAVSAEEASQLAHLHRPDLVTMDIRLRGERDGVDAAIEIYRRDGVRSLFVSAHSDDRTRVRAEAANPLGWVAKPFSGTQLLRAVREAVRDLRSRGDG